MSFNVGPNMEIKMRTFFYAVVVSTSVQIPSYRSLVVLLLLPFGHFWYQVIIE